MVNKIIIFCAPSGAGKTTIAHAMLDIFPELEFSISATSRPSRGKEEEGVDYYFLQPDEFKKKVRSGDFLEWEEFYNGTLYGTLKEEVFRIQNLGKIPVFDIDVKGAMNLKKIYGDMALVIFIKAPIEVIKERLLARKTETAETLELRIQRSKEEMTYENRADKVIENIDLNKAISDCKKVMEDFIKNELPIMDNK
jgi:guanylate kinase